MAVFRCGKKTGRMDKGSPSHPFERQGYDRIYLGRQCRSGPNAQPAVLTGRGSLIGQRRGWATELDESLLPLQQQVCRIRFSFGE